MAPVLVVIALIFAGDQVVSGVSPEVRASAILGATIARVAAILLTVVGVAATLTLAARTIRARRRGGVGGG